MQIWPNGRANGRGNDRGAIAIIITTTAGMTVAVRQNDRPNGRDNNRSATIVGFTQHWTFGQVLKVIGPRPLL